MAEYTAELVFVQNLAREAAAWAMQRAGQAKPEEKANKSYVTDLDRELEQLIRGRLASEYPDDLLTGEEYDPSGGGGPRRWSIDPIDGTGNLVHDLPLWAISLGLIDAGEPVLGVIAIPPLRELYWAVRGRGAYRDGRRLHMSDKEIFHNQDNVHVGTNALRAIDARTVPGRLRDLGSACCELAFLACNRLEACTFLGEHTHDLAAGAVIAAEAGAAFGTIDGRSLRLAEVVAETPVRTPTFIAAPQRLAFLMSHVQRLA